MHLLVAISSHGFGHGAQVAPVVAELKQRMPSLTVTLMSSLPGEFLYERFAEDVSLIPEAPDFGLIMNSALEVNLDASAAAYRERHLDWSGSVVSETRRLKDIAPDVVLADIPYLTLAAAQRAGIPAVALCSLNWADIYRWYFSSRKESSGILEQMEDAYRSASAFLCPQPSMPMPFLENRVSIGPIANRGICRGDALRDRLGISGEEVVVLVAPGGVQARFSMEEWPSEQGIRWLVSETWRVQHPNVSSLESCNMAFADLLTSCDVVLGKCGYGTVTECVVNRTPLLYVERPDWPEEGSLVEWLEAHRGGVGITPEHLRSGELLEAVLRAKSLQVEPCVANGAVQAAQFLERLLTGDH